MRASITYRLEDRTDIYIYATKYGIGKVADALFI